ncbi:MAG: response regulator [Candidatus Helarchaeota archaeon]
MINGLVVDNGNAVGKNLTLMLINEGYNVTYLSNFQLAKQIIKNARYDFYVIDVSNSDGEGIEFIKIIKQSTQSGIVIKISEPPKVPVAIFPAGIDICENDIHFISTISRNLEYLNYL